MVQLEERDTLANVIPYWPYDLDGPVVMSDEMRLVKPHVKRAPSAAAVVSVHGHGHVRAHGRVHLVDSYSRLEIEDECFVAAAAASGPVYPQTGFEAGMLDVWSKMETALCVQMETSCGEAEGVIVLSQETWSTSAPLVEETLHACLVAASKLGAVVI